jgi:hypothetical protein
MSLVKLKKALAIAVAALQIPLLMLWKIILDSLMGGSSLVQLKIDRLGNRVYESVFKWELFWKSFGIHLPVLLALTACFVLAVLGLISILRKKRVTVPTICFYAMTFLACGFLCFAFARPAAILGTDKGYMLMTYELVFFRYFGGMELRFDISLFPLLRAIKFLLLGLCMAASGALCGLGIAEAVQKKKAPPLVTETIEPELYQVQGRREID